MKRNVHTIDRSQVLAQFLPQSATFLSPKYRSKRAIKFSLPIDSNRTPLADSLSSANQDDVVFFRPYVEPKL